MPKTFFECPDGEEVRIESCLEGCRMEQRCMSLPSLATIGLDRPWTGVSASAAGTGARQLYLKIIHDYCVNPRASVYALYGSKSHALKESQAKNLNAFLEQEVDGGTCDFYDGSIVDYKLVGAYALSKRTIFEEVPTGENYKSGPRKGSPKFRRNPIGFHLDEEDDWRLQLNRYRLGWEDAGFSVTSMWIEVVLRDGGLASSRYGFEDQVYMLPVERLEDEYTRSVYQRKQDQVDRALADHLLPEICTAAERWDGRRCQDYCDVAEWCYGWREGEG